MCDFCERTLLLNKVKQEVVDSGRRLSDKLHVIRECDDISSGIIDSIEEFETASGKLMLLFCDAFDLMNLCTTHDDEIEVIS